MYRILFYFLPFFIINSALAYTQEDTLKGRNGAGRDWWKVLHYDLTVAFDLKKKSITGTNVIRFKYLKQPNDSMQIDLQNGMLLDSAIYKGKKLKANPSGNIWWVTVKNKMNFQNENDYIKLYYHGQPQEAVNPPWDGGFVWKKDENGQDWVAVACQGLGASSWWPCKDFQAEEPDSGMDMRFWVDSKFQVVSNGKLVQKISGDTIVSFWHYKVQNPINSYNATFYIGNYTHWTDTLLGENGKLNLDFYALKQNETKAKNQFKQVKPMLHCFEYWMGPYPFYEDGYKIIEAPYLGMEHQSAIAYGNKFQNGYLGKDLSETGVGLKFDFIIVHESGHEWWGNNITAKDKADNWIHEGITTYAEGLFAECLFWKTEAQKYIIGEWKRLLNDKPIIGDYGVNNEGSSDEYDKGSALIHTIRTIYGNDEIFRTAMRAANKRFYHQTVTSKDIETLFIEFAPLDLEPIFNQYLRSVEIPILNIKMQDGNYIFSFSNCNPDFYLPIKIKQNNSVLISKAEFEISSKEVDKDYLFEQLKNYLIIIKE